MSGNLLRLAIVSDMHCKKSGENPRSTYLYSDLLAKPPLHNPVEALKYLIKEEKLTADFLLCPGDIADQMDVQGLVSGWKYLEEIKRSLGVTTSISTVGNHDVNSHGGLKQSYNYHVQNLDDNYPINDHEHLCNQFWGKDHYFIYDSPQLMVWVFDSCHDHTDKDKARSSNVPEVILTQLESQLKNIQQNNKIKIALLHHHPKPFSNLEEIYEDGDVLTRGDRLADILEKNNFDLVIHGHKHIPRLDYFNSRLPIFCAGSFSSRANVSDIPHCNNTFHVIDFFLDSKLPDSFAQGIIKTWEFTYSRGWQMTKNVESCFPAFTGFGNQNRDMNLLANRINTWFKKNYSELGKEATSYSKVLENFSELNFLVPSEQLQLSNTLKSRYRLEFSYSLGINPKSLSIISND